MSPQKRDAVYHKIHDVIAHRPKSGVSPQQENAIYHELHDVIGYRP